MPEANDNPADGLDSARIMIEKLRELATLEDRNMKRHAIAIRAWSGEAAGMIDRLARIAYADPAKSAPISGDLRHPIDGIENSTAPEVCDIVADHSRLAHPAAPPGEGLDDTTAQFPVGTMYRSGHDGTGPDPSLFSGEAVSDAPECRRVRVVAKTEAEARLQAAAALSALDTKEPQ
jgi:hypothetical protein